MNQSTLGARMEAALLSCLGTQPLPEFDTSHLIPLREAEARQNAAAAKKAKARLYSRRSYVRHREKRLEYMAEYRRNRRKNQT